MPLLAHVMELRKRLIHSLWGILLCFGITYHFSEDLYAWILKPLCRSFETHCPVVYQGLAEPFLVYLKVGLVFGFFLSAPWIFYQIWKFISPGLHSHEKKWVVPFVSIGSVMFVGGALLGYFFIFPFAFEFFLSQARAPLTPMLSMDDYFTFASGLLFAFGFLFEIPVFVVLLNAIGILRAELLWRTWRYVTAVLFVLAAVLTPADPYTMLLLGVPLASLYILALCVCSILEKVRGLSDVNSSGRSESRAAS